MFNFLNPGVLAAAAAALVPLIIHLFSKRRVQIVEFSSVRHLKAMQKRQVRRLKIRQLLLLILRMAIILALVLAFARPSTTGGSIGSHASVSAVILFDNSASMNRYVADGSLYEISKTSVERLLGNFGEADEVAVIFFDENDKNNTGTGFTSAAVAIDKLLEVKPGFAGGNLGVALQRATELLDQAKNLNKELYVVSDRQRRSLPEESHLSAFTGSVYFVDLPTETIENCGITSVDFGGQLLMPGHEFNIAANLRNYGTEDRSDLIASLFVNGNRVAQVDAATKASSDGVVRFPHTVNRPGFHSGWVELSDDKFVADNRYYFAFNIPDRFNLLIIGNTDAARLVELALVPDESAAQYWSAKSAAPDQLSGVNFFDYDLVMLVGTPEIDPTYVDRLKAFVQSGRSLFISYEGTADIERLNRDWAQVSGVTYDEAARQQFTRAGFYGLQTVDSDHPIFSVFGLEGKKLPQIKFFTLPKTHTDEFSRTIVRFTGDRPALVETMYGEGRVLTFTGPISPRYSDLVEHAFFVPFVSRIAEYLAFDLSSFDMNIYCGVNGSRSVALRGSIAASVELMTPDSSHYLLPPQEEDGSLVVRIDATDLPGEYRLSYQGREIDRFAVNVDPAECDLAESDVEQFATALGVDEYRTVPFDTDMAPILAELRFGKELWQLFLWLALILLLAEMLVSRTEKSQE